MRISILLLFLIAGAIPQAAAQKESEWDEFRFTDSDREVAAGLMEVQKLMQGREALLRSYQQTDRGYIATEREIEKFRQDAGSGRYSLSGSSRVVHMQRLKIS